MMMPCGARIEFQADLMSQGEGRALMRPHPSRLVFVLPLRARHEIDLERTLAPFFFVQGLHNGSTWDHYDVLALFLAAQAHS